MRLAAQAKLGFYPAHPTAVSAIASHLVLQPDKASQVRILDPCCGEGEAIGQLGHALGVAPDNIYAVELDQDRAARARDRLVGGSVLGPATFLGVQITGQSFGMVYCNPPFDSELGGGRREEFAFAGRCGRLLPTGGVLVLVCPVNMLQSNSDLQGHLDSFYEDAALYVFPEEVRHFREVVFIGKKRKVEIPVDWNSATFFRSLRLWDHAVLERLPVVGSDSRAWTLPSTWKPHTFKKIVMTQEELEDALATSPLNKLLDPPKAVPPKSPPLPLHKGHVALLLASGMLDGLVEPAGEKPHVVRGTARKVDYISERTQTEDEESGAITTKTVTSQRIELIVRAVGQDGEIKTFGEVKPKEADPAEVEERYEQEAA